MHDPSEADTAELLLPVKAVALDLPRPRSSLVRVDFGAVTHTGRVRPNNEDAYLVFRTGRYWEKLAASLPAGDLPGRHEENGYVMAVADGMGGAAGGEMASSLALRAAVNLVLTSVKWSLKLDEPSTREAEITEAIRRAEDYFRRIDRTLSDAARSDPALSGMGTTLTASYSFGSDLFILHVGDSRAYLLRDSLLVQLTRDQTLAQRLADSGRIRPEEVKGHRLGHVLTQAVGTKGGNIRTETQRLDLLDDDTLLLCTDGLTDLMQETEIAGRLTAAASAQEACCSLVDLALEKGGRDNVTALVARYTIPPLSPLAGSARQDPTEST